MDAFCLTDAPGRAFVAGGHEGIMAVDAASDQLRGVWRNEYYPIGLFADSAHGKLYCLGEYPALVSVIDPFANRILSSIPLAGYPHAMAFNTVDRKAYVAVEEYHDVADAIVVLDAVGDTVLAEIAVARAPGFLAYDADDDLLYAARSNSDRVLAIDGKTDSVIDSTWVSEDCRGLVYNAARHRLYSLGSVDEVTAFTPRTHGQNSYISVDAELQLFALDESGTRLYAGNPDDDVIYVIDCVGESLAGVIRVSAPPVALSYDAQHDRLYCAHGDEEGVSVVDCSWRATTAVIPVSASFLYWDAGTDDIYCVGESGLAVVDGGTHKVTATLDMGWPLGVASAPGWPRVYVADNNETYLTVIRTDEWPQVRAVPDAQATVVRGRLDWTGTLAVMYDMGGRRIADVHRGGNDVSRLHPGVYFIRQNGVRRGTYARKVVVTR